MEILHTIEIPERGDHKVSAASDELAIARLYERLRDEADEDEKLIQITPAMITEREFHFGMDEFLARYRLIKNPANEGGGEPCDCMFETYGGELSFVRGQPRERIWTLIEEDGVLWLIAGYRYVNRLGYFVTEETWRDPEEIYLYGD
ncbi:MAG: hypothetical protein MSG64_20510 [Pyrinomonadaceae bacterium MAG19_C2-C3]|nr:hypothetical protein [Pyrinomonadaceae bacterium MAG19_C2-C3]